MAIITTPGKFEGEEEYVRYYWGRGLEGCADFDDGGEYRFNILPDDVAMFPELKAGQVLTLIEDDNGFVHSELTDAPRINHELYAIDGEHILKLKAAAKRLYSENRMGGDEMRDMAQVLDTIAQFAEGMKVP
jgi:hypothetical protein